MGATEFLVGPLSLALSLVALMGGLGLPVVTLLIRLVDYRCDQGEFSVSLRLTVIMCLVL